MHLLKLNDDGSLSLSTFSGNNIPNYAILSHTWETDRHQEVAFHDIGNDKARSKKGYRKIRFCGEQAQKDGLQYFWIDSCCIDRSSSAELSEAINSMYRWYQNSARCYVYLSDVSIEGSAQNIHNSSQGSNRTSHLPYELALRQSRWITRGWTLQELLAPKSVEFFSSEGKLLGDKKTLEFQLHKATGIAVQALRGSGLWFFTVTERMAWAADRETTIEEDQAYSLLGIFDVYMPLIYGEGKEHAFRRLWKELSAHEAIETPARGPARLANYSSVAEKTDACLAHLPGTDQTPFLSRILSCSKDACTWICQNQTFLSWNESDVSSVLRVTASAGCGKTTLAAHTIRMISTNQITTSASEDSGGNSVVLSFFFRGSRENEAITALSTTVKQLLRQMPQGLRILLSRHALLSTKGSFEWSLVGLLKLMANLLEQAPRASRIYLILDSLDSCEIDSRTLILDSIKAMIKQYSASSSSMTSGRVLKVLITGSSNDNIGDLLSDCLSLHMSKDDTGHDLRLLVDNRMEEIARRRYFSSDVDHKIVRFLEENANGSFLWAILVLKELERMDLHLTDEMVVSKLLATPTALMKAYEVILRNTPPRRKKDMWRVFRWLLFGARHLTLEELETGLCLELGIPGWNNFANDVEALCGSFLRFNGAREEVNFIHQTARVFLHSFIRKAKSADIAYLEMDYRKVNEQLATICVQYLLREEEFFELNVLLAPIAAQSQKSHASFVAATGGFLKRYPFLRYAIESWVSHIRATGTPSPAMAAMVRKLLSSSRHRDGIMILTMFIKHQSSSAPVHQTPLHLAAYFNFPWLVSFYVTQNASSVDAVSLMHDTPLVWASEMGSTECVKILLGAGADPNKLEYDGWSALHWAARNGHLEVATLLLEYGARWDQEDSKGYTPLDWAVDREHWDVVSVLEKYRDKSEPEMPLHSQQDQ